MKQLFFGILCSMLFVPTFMSAYSYIFIQGDKQTPIYVKVEGKMAPRLGLHYSIISNLDKGEVTIEILFQENKYPVQQYKIMVPEEGYRGFLLTKVDEKNFSLYDLQSKGFIPNKNLEDEAFVDFFKPKENSYIIANNTKEESKNDVPILEADKKQNNETINNKSPNDGFLDLDLDEQKAYKQAQKEKEKLERQQKRAEKRAQRQIDNNSGTVKTDEDTKESETTTNENNVTAANTANTDCSQAMSDKEFEQYTQSLVDNHDDEFALRYIRNSYQQYCFSTQQAGILSGMIHSPSASFEMLKTIYPNVSDKENYDQLENVFQSNYLKKQFRKLIGNE